MKFRFSWERMGFLYLGFILGLFGTAMTAAGGTYTLDVAKTGAGAGIVYSSIGGIDCGFTCSSDYPDASPYRVVTLTASPDPGSYFNGWSGDCFGQALTCKVTMDAAKTVSVDFTTTPPAAVPWVKTLGSSAYDGGYAVRQTSDGGYIIAGQISNYFAAVKLGADGSLVWQKSYSSSAGKAYSAEQTSDGGYIIAGSKWVGMSGVMNYVPLILKLGSDGSIIWQKYIYEYNGFAYSVQQASDGSYVVGGTSQPSSSDPSYFWIAKISADGSGFVWGKTYGSGGSAGTISQTPDAGFIAAGSNNSGTWVVKLSAIGDADVSMDWQNNYNSPISSLSQTSDGGYITTGGASIMKLNADGSVAWQKTYTTSAASLQSVQETYDGGFIVAGGKDMSGGTFWNYDIWILKLNASGDVIWQKTYSKSTNEIANSVQQTSDGGYIVTAGPTSSYSQSTDALWALKLDAEGNVLGCQGPFAIPASGTITDDTPSRTQTYLTQADSDRGLSTQIGSAFDPAGTLTGVCSGTGPMLSMSPSSPLDFGAVALNTTASQPLILSNNGNATLNLSDIWMSAGSAFSFDVTAGGKPCGSETAAISAGDSCTVLLNFTPSVIGSQSNDLYIYSDNPGPAAFITLEGTGFAPLITSASSSTASGHYTTGKAINVKINFNEAVSSAGLTITLNTGATIATGALSGAKSYIGVYTVAAGQNASALNVDFVTGTITDSDGAATINPPVPAGANIANVKTIVIDTTPPSITIGAPSKSVTNSGPVTYKVTYSGGTITLSAADITLNKTGTANGTVGVSSSGETRVVTISGIAGDGTLGVSVAADTAKDAVGNLALAAGPGKTFKVDNTPPSITMSAPSKSVTNSGPVTYNVTYSGGTITLSAADISLYKTGTANGTVGVSATGNPRVVTISGVTGDGTLGISIAAGTATDAAGNPADAAGLSKTFTVDNTPPSITIGAPSARVTKKGPVTYNVTYSGHKSITLSVADIILNKSGTANGKVVVSSSGNPRVVTVSGLTGNGTLGISIHAGTATDAAGNLAPASSPSGTFSVNN